LAAAPVKLPVVDHRSKDIQGFQAQARAAAAPCGSDNEYVIIAPVNSGNSIFLIDSGTGMTGTCQKV
jgi:hypothetical protein